MIAPRPTVLIADDHRPLAEAVRLLLSDEFEVLAIVSDGESLIAEALRLAPDVLIVDIAMPGITGIETVRRLIDGGCAAAMVMLTTYEEPEYVARALEAGARGYVSKNRLMPDLILAVRRVLEGGTFLSRM